MGKAISASLKKARSNLREAAKQSGMTLEEIGLAMGYSKSSARQAVSRLLNDHAELDPRLTTLIQFADALNTSLPQLFS
jgi:transcriptional regulator with XRE-family HTH domain